MRKWPLYLLPLLLLPLNTVEAQTQVLTQWGQDNSGTTRQVYVLNPTDLHWISIGSFNTNNDTFTINLPTPTASTLGGVFSSSAPANQFATGINTSGAVTYAQPSFSNLSGSLACGQTPALTGNVTTSAGSCSTTIPSNTITNAMLQSGVATANLGSAAQNLVFATPNGSSGTGSFRALVANDIPNSLNATTFTGNITLNNSVLARWQNASNNYTSGSAGGDILVLSDNKMYVDEYDTGTFIFRGASFGVELTMTPSAITANENIAVSPSSSAAQLALYAPTGNEDDIVFNVGVSTKAYIFSNTSYDFGIIDVGNGSTGNFLINSAGNTFVGEPSKTVTLTGASFSAPSGTISGSLTINDPSTSDIQALAINATSDINGANIALSGNGVTTPNKYLRIVNGLFQIVNSAYSTAILNLNDSGNLTISGNYLYFVSSTGGVNGSGGAFIYGDSSNIVPHLGAGNQCFEVQNTSGTNIDRFCNGSNTIGLNQTDTNNFNGSIQAIASLSTNPGSYWQFNAGETWAGGTAFADPFFINDTMGSGGTGQRQTLTAQFQSGYGGNGNFNYVAAAAFAEACGSTADGARTSFCSGQLGGGSGHFFGFNTSVQADNGSSGDMEIVGYESDVACRNTGNCARKTGIQIISVNNDQSHASNATLDDGLLIDGGSGVGFTYGIYIASCVSGCGNVVATTLMAAGPITVVNGIDFSLTTFQGKAFKSNGFSVDNNGQIIGNGKASFGNGATVGVSMTLINSAGTCTHTPGAASETVSCSSDRRLKYDIYPSETSALDLIDTFHIDQFRLNADNSFHPFGVIAQEVQENHPEMVHQNGEYLTVDQPDPWMLLKAIQELQAEVRARR